MYPIRKSFHVRLYLPTFVATFEYILLSCSWPDIFAKMLQTSLSTLAQISIFSLVIRGKNGHLEWTVLWTIWTFICYNLNHNCHSITQEFFVNKAVCNNQATVVSCSAWSWYTIWLKNTFSISWQAINVPIIRKRTAWE